MAETFYYNVESKGKGRYFTLCANNEIILVDYPYKAKGNYQIDIHNNNGSLKIKNLYRLDDCALKQNKILNCIVNINFNIDNDMIDGKLYSFSMDPLHACLLNRHSKKDIYYHKENPNIRFVLLDKD